MAARSVSMRIRYAGEVVDYDGTELAALAVDLPDEDLADIGPQVLDLLEVLKPGHGVVGALQGIIGQGGMPCVPQRQPTDPGILQDLGQLLAGSWRDVYGIDIVHVNDLGEGRDGVAGRRCHGLA